MWEKLWFRFLRDGNISNDTSANGDNQPGDIFLCYRSQFCGMEGGVTLCFRDITACCSAQFTKGWLPGEFSKISQPLLSRTGDRNNKYHHVAGSSFVEDSWNDLKRRLRVDKRFRRENDLSSVVGYKMPFKIECHHLRCYVTLVLQISFTCIVKLLRRTRRIIRKIDVYV